MLGYYLMAGGYARRSMVEPLDLSVEKYDRSWVPMAVLALCDLMVHADGHEDPAEWDAVVEALATYPAFKRFAKADFHHVVTRSRKGFFDLDSLVVDCKARFAPHHLHDIVAMLNDVMGADEREHPREAALLAVVQDRLVGDLPPPEKG